MSSRWKTSAAAFSLIALAILLPALLGTLTFGADSWWRVPFHFFCHGIASHSFFIGGVAMPICARCTGIYAGLLLGVLLSSIASSVAPRLAWRFFFLCLLPMWIDGGTQALGLRVSNNPLRFFTGIAFGAAFLFAVLLEIEHGARRDAEAPHTTAHQHS